MCLAPLLDISLGDANVLAIGITHRHRLGCFLHQQAGQGLAPGGGDHLREILVRDCLAWQQDGVEQILAAGFHANQGKVGADTPALSAHNVAAGALQVTLRAGFPEFAALVGVALSFGQFGRARQFLRIQFSGRRKNRCSLATQVHIGTIADNTASQRSHIRWQLAGLLLTYQPAATR